MTQITCDQADIEKNKVMAILAYIFFLIPLLVAKDSKFAKYHTNQGLILFLFGFGGSIALFIVNIILMFIPVIGWLLGMVLSLGLLGAILAGIIIGIKNSIDGVCAPLPVIGNLFTIIKCD